MSFNKRILEVKPSATLELQAQINAMKAKGMDVIGFGAGEPDFETPENVCQAGIKAVQENFCKYTATAGIPELREAIAGKFTRENKIDCDKKNVMVSNGAKQCLFNALFVLLNNGDEVIVPAPYWVSYIEQIKLCGGKPVIVHGIEENAFKISLNQLEKARSSKTKVLMIGSPGNPSGVTYSEKELRDIATWCLENKIKLISDEVYEHMVYEGVSFSAASMGADYLDNTITVNAVSKTYSMTGWRVGYVCASEEIIKQMTTMQSHTTSNASSISQKAALEAITGSQKEVEKRHGIFKARRDLMIEKLNATTGISCVKPRGAIFAFPNVSACFKGEIKTSLDFSTFLLEKARVAVVPGEAFGSDQHVRLSFSYDEKTIIEGLDRITKAVEL